MVNVNAGVNALASLKSLNIDKMQGDIASLQNRVSRAETFTPHA
jgi:hypothetical protein